MPQIRANGIQIEYEEFGERAAPAILLIMGLGCQLIHWPDDLCHSLAGAGYRVIRYDNRDAGLSSKLDHADRVKLIRAGILSTFRLPVKAAYTLDDMAQDALGLMDALKLPRAHVVGVSMGGMIAQLIAIHHPDRMLSLTSIMSNSGNPLLPGPSLRIRLRMIKRPSRLDRESLIRHSMQTWRMIGSPGYPQEESALRAKVERAYDRCVHARGLARQTVAILASRNRAPLLKRIVAPTLIIHGKEDPLVPVAAAYELARHIPGARLEIIPGMGHDLPPALVPRLAQLILGNVKNGGDANSKNAGVVQRRRATS